MKIGAEITWLSSILIFLFLDKYAYEPLNLKAETAFSFVIELRLVS
jgi:hypothetical protein